MIRLTISGKTAERLEELRKQTVKGTGEYISPEKYAMEIIETFLIERRSGITPREHGRHWNRHTEYYTWDTN